MKLTPQERVNLQEESTRGWLRPSELRRGGVYHQEVLKAAARLGSSVNPFRPTTPTFVMLIKVRQELHRCRR